MRRPAWFPALSATTAVVIAAMALIVGMALSNMARVNTAIPSGVYLPKSSGVAPQVTSPVGDPNSAAPASSATPATSPPGSSVPPAGSTHATAGSPAPPSTVGAYRNPTTETSSGSDTSVNTVPPNYPVDVSRDGPSPDSGESTGQTTPTTASHLDN